MTVSRNEKDRSSGGLINRVVGRDVPHRDLMNHEVKVLREQSKKEFWIVRMLVIAFGFLIALVLILPPHWITGTFGDKSDVVIEFKKEIASLLIAAFGPWIAAGAAFFFGRENLREAYQNFRSQETKSVEEILRGSLVKDVPPDGPRYIVGPDTPFREIKNRLIEDESLWFFTYVDQNGEYVATIHEEAIYRFAAEREAYEDFDFDYRSDETNLQTVLIAVASKRKKIDFVPSDSGIIQSLDQAVKLSPDLSLFAASEMMDRDRKFVGVVLNESNRPVGYITTSQLRRKLMEAPSSARAS